MPAASPLRLWCNYGFREPLADQLRAATARHQLTLAGSRASAPAPGEPVPDILLGQPDAAYLLAHPPRWVEITSAGYTLYDRDDLRRAFRARSAILTNTSRVFNESCAQHLAAMVLALARELPRCLDNQRGERRWLHDEPRQGRRFLLNGQKAILYGFGAIARRVAEILRVVGLELVGVRRAPQGDEGIPMLTGAAADSRLAEMDHVLNILPANGSTAHFFDAARLARCKPGARFYNLGRGATVDQDALAAALRAGHLQAAYLDVTEPEPLPPAHPLWDVPNCFITPHVAGVHDGEDAQLLQHFLANLAAYEAGRELVDRVF